MRLGGCSATGPRDANEDSFFVIDFSNVGLFTNGVTSFAMVSDGMGGYQGGDVASGLAVSSAERYIDQLLEMAEGNRVEFDAALALSEIVQNAHEAIVAESKSRGNASMGATFVGAFLSPTHAWIGHVGDSRAYLLRNGEAVQLTEDHSQVGRMLKQGLITEEEAQNHPARNRIERALGFTDAAPEITEVDFESGDGLLMCSDGVYTVLDASAIAASVAKSHGAENAARRAVKSALSAGTDDNSTAVVIFNEPDGHSSSANRNKQLKTRTALTSSTRQGSSSGVHARTAVRGRGYSGRQMSKSREKSRIPYILIPFAVFAALVVGAIALFVGLGTDGQGRVSESTPAPSAGVTASQPNSTPQSDSRVEYTVIGEVPLRYLDGAGMAQSFSDAPIYFNAGPFLIEGASVLAGSESDNYGREFSYRELDEVYLDALRVDCASCREGAIEFDSSLASVIDQDQYAILVAALADSKIDYEITGLVVYADNLLAPQE